MSDKYIIGKFDEQRGAYPTFAAKDFECLNGEVKNGYQGPYITESALLAGALKQDDTVWGDPNSTIDGVISEKLEVINSQLARQRASRRRAVHWAFIILCAITITVMLIIVAAGSPYQNWDYSDPENAVVGVVLHAFEWVFVRVAPLAIIGTVVGAVLTRKRI